jgi:hypothetical protein
MARLTTTPWGRKKQAMIRKDQLQASPGESEEESGDSPTLKGLRLTNSVNPKMRPDAFSRRL